jgi:hypothetical protein
MSTGVARLISSLHLLERLPRLQSDDAMSVGKPAMQNSILHCYQLAARTFFWTFVERYMTVQSAIDVFRFRSKPDRAMLAENTDQYWTRHSRAMPIGPANCSPPIMRTPQLSCAITCRQKTRRKHQQSSPVPIDEKDRLLISL